MRKMYKSMKVLAMAATMIGGASLAQNAPKSYGPPVTLARAHAIVDAAHREAKARNMAMAFAVVLPSGDPILLEVMDGTQAASITIAPAKARSAARFRRPTKVFADAVAAGNMGMLTLDEIVAIEGGVPIVDDGRVIGALGVSGGTAAEDGEIAAAALRAVAND
ncbi:uncharacterized protein GlcG (DUF336 family) [Hephaestia caeni]|uniref:Uncharacterized protein GlcG (DUF336 family) n=1 Tax=Hephaestia caeni TaxID=645617 RepID=A0A397PI41_9SPHN|nr:heme-binding protein [Hephaestia caeni]RIA46945.1 uncharacterized protein GlcG (DUF336 family) [Hephaestia caeni]